MPRRVWPSFWHSTYIDGLYYPCTRHLRGPCLGLTSGYGTQARGHMDPEVACRCQLLHRQVTGVTHVRHLCIISEQLLGAGGAAPPPPPPRAHTAAHTQRYAESGDLGASDGIVGSISMDVGQRHRSQIASQSGHRSSSQRATATSVRGISSIPSSACWYHVTMLHHVCPCPSRIACSP